MDVRTLSREKYAVKRRKELSGMEKLISNSRKLSGFPESEYCSLKDRQQEQGELAPIRRRR
jgi:hypothetical protein